MVAGGSVEMLRNRIASEVLENPAVKKGRNTNLLEIIRNGPSIHFKVNGDVVFTSDFVNFFGNKIGFILFGEMKAAVDLLRISN